MSVTEVTLKNGGLGGTATGGKDGSASRSYTAQYIVTVTSDTLSPDYVLSYFRQNSDLPWPGRIFNISGGYDVESICKTVTAKYTENSGGQYIVDASYQAEEPQDEQKPDQNGKNTTNPLLWSDEIDIGFTQLSIPVEVGEFRAFQPNPIDNRFLRPGAITPIVNSAMKPFDPTLEEESQIKIIRISKYSQTSQVEAFNKYIGAINSDRVVINKPTYGYRDSFEPYRGLIKSLSATFAITNGVPHFKQSVELHVCSLLFGWFRPIVDRGLDARRAPEDPDGNGGTVSFSDIATAGVVAHEPIKDKEGVPVTEPVLLDGNGQPLKPGLPPVYLIYNVRKILPFSPIRW